MSPRSHIAILGSGPIGLEAALAAAERGFSFTVFEAGPTAGANVERWGHVRLFTPWDMNLSPRMRKGLEEARATPPAGSRCPTGSELVERVLKPLAALGGIAPHLELGTRVVAVGRRGLLKHEEIATPRRGQHPFRILVEDRQGRESVRDADVVLDCTGSQALPNPLGDGGIPAPGEAASRPWIRHDIPDLAREATQWLRRKVLVVGAGHSAQTAVRDLAELASKAPSDAPEVLWATRQESPTWGAVEDDVLTERARLARDARQLADGSSPAVQVLTGVVVEALDPGPNPDGGTVTALLRNGDGSTRPVEVHRILALTGSTGDGALYRQLQVHECYATCGPMKLAATLLQSAGGDCLTQTSHGVDTLKNPEPGFFILGSKSYGRNNTFLLRVGFQQVQEVFEVLTP